MSRSEPEAKDELTEDVRQVQQAFKHAYRSLNRRKGQDTHLVGGTEISQAQFELMIELRKRGPVAVGELAQAMGLSPASVSQMVDRLSEHDHVERTRSDDDRRVVRVGLSQRGEEAIEPVIEGWRNRWREAMAEIPEQDLRAASQVLNQIAGIYE